MDEARLAGEVWAGAGVSSQTSVAGSACSGPTRPAKVLRGAARFARKKRHRRTIVCRAGIRAPRGSSAASNATAERLGENRVEGRRAASRMGARPAECRSRASHGATGSKLARPGAQSGGRRGLPARSTSRRSAVAFDAAVAARGVTRGSFVRRGSAEPVSRSGRTVEAQLSFCNRPRSAQVGCPIP